MGIARTPSTLDTLLVLSRTLAGARQGGLLGDALDLLLAGVGCSRGAAYAATGDALELVADRGLQAKLRPHLERLPLTGEAWFAAQRAAHSRKLVTDRDLAGAERSPLDRAALALSRWAKVVACPICSGREVYGVMVLAWPEDEEPRELALAVVEIACNMLALHSARRGQERRQARARESDLRATRMAALGIVASGFAEQLDAHLAEIGRRLDDHGDGGSSSVTMPFQSALPAPGHDGGRPPIPPGLAAASLGTIGRSPPEVAEALRPAREVAARFLAAIQPSAPERLDLGAVVADALALAAPRLRRRGIEVTLHTAGEHVVVGRRSELLQLFIQVVLGMAGALDDAEEVGAEQAPPVHDGGSAGSADSAGSAPKPPAQRAFALAARHQDGHEVVTMTDAGDGSGARASFFEIGGPAGVAAFDLAVARHIVIAHEGHIELGPTGGGECTVALPAAGSEVDRHAARAGLTRGGRRPRSDRPRAVLLWIDEDDLFLEIMVQSLPELDVRTARSAAEAMPFLSAGAMPALVFCNVRLPDRPGHALHAEMVRQRPEVADRFVFVAEGVLTPEAASYVIASGLPALMRPIDLDAVRELASRDPVTPYAATTTAATLADEHRDDPRRIPAAPMRAAVRPPPVARDAATAEASLSRPDDPPTPAPPPACASPRDATRGPERSSLRAAAGDTRPPGAPAAPTKLGDTPKPPAASSNPPAAAASSMRDHELAAIARVVAETLRRQGPKRGGAVSAMLRERGLSEPEALAVLTFALSNGLLTRDPPPSSLLRAPDADLRKTVLVVDDDYDLRQTLKEVLQDEGYQVETAANGKEALDVLHRSNPPRVMVLDLMMPVMDGWQLLEALRHDESLADLPVVVISAGKGVRAPDAREYLSKPLDYYKLVTTLERSMQPPVHDGGYAPKPPAAGADPRP
jgi:CheY-like chemotaxis protein